MKLIILSAEAVQGVVMDIERRSPTRRLCEVDFWKPFTIEGRTDLFMRVALSNQERKALGLDSKETKQGVVCRLENRLTALGRSIGSGRTLRGVVEQWNDYAVCTQLALDTSFFPRVVKDIDFSLYVRRDVSSQHVPIEDCLPELIKGA